jgi:GNAT superfamily N-acetyltransferase
VTETAPPWPNPPEDLVIRRGTEADLPRVVELLARGAVPGTSEEREAEPEQYRAALRDIDRSGSALLVAELEGEVVGVCQLIVFRHIQAGGGRCAEIESVHVYPDRRGHGIGTALMRHAIERARALGCYRVQLTSNTVREDAHRFYESLGFAPSHVGFKLSLD